MLKIKVMLCNIKTYYVSLFLLVLFCILYVPKERQYVKHLSTQVDYVFITTKGYYDRLFSSNIPSGEIEMEKTLNEILNRAKVTPEYLKTKEMLEIEETAKTTLNAMYQRRLKPHYFEYKKIRTDLIFNNLIGGILILTLFFFFIRSTILANSKNYKGLMLQIKALENKYSSIPEFLIISKAVKNFVQDNLHLFLTNSTMNYKEYAYGYYLLELQKFILSNSHFQIYLNNSDVLLKIHNKLLQELYDEKIITAEKYEKIKNRFYMDLEVN